MPVWLWRSIVGTGISIIALALAQWYSCRFYVLPSILPLMSKESAGKGQVDTQLLGCSDTDSKSIAVVVSVLTTLISLSRKAE